MYASPPQTPPIRRQQKKPKNQVATRPRNSVALSRGLNQSLHQALYKGLYEGSKTDAPATAHVRLASPAATVRKVNLLPGETVTHTFCPKEGLIPHPREEGRMLVLTNQRVIAFGQKDGMTQTVLMPVEEVKSVAVNTGRRSKSTLFQGGLMIVAGGCFYLLLAYWLTGQVGGPSIPVIRMNLVSFLVFLAILSGVGMVAQTYFSRPDGEVTFQGDGVTFTFPIRGKTAEDQIYHVVNATFAARQSIVGYFSLGVK